jgi:NAD(P)H-flavin reductase
MMTASFRDNSPRALVPDPLVPRFLPVKRRVRETADVVSLEIAVDDVGVSVSGFSPGQFNMLYAFGVGEIPISVSGDLSIATCITHTIRSVGPVSAALAKLRPGDHVGIRGPFGSCWPIEEAAGNDVLVIASGIGLVPLRPALYHLLRHRDAYGRVALLYGARKPEDLLYRRELDIWRRTPNFQVRVTLSRAGPDWVGDVGYVTGLLPKARFTPADAIAMVCGPEPMIRSTALALENIGMAPNQIFVSLERNMKCAVGFCGHCQFGPHFICKDGPVYRYDRVRELMAVREL